MSELHSQQESSGSFTGGIWNADDPPSDIQVHGYQKRPSWPFLSDKRELQSLCVFIITSQDLEKASKSFIDIASAISKKVGYFCNPTVIVESKFGHVACTLEVTKDARQGDVGDAAHARSPADVEQRRRLAADLAVEIANALTARGYRNLN